MSAKKGCIEQPHSGLKMYEIDAFISQKKTYDSAVVTLLLSHYNNHNLLTKPRRLFLLNSPSQTVKFVFQWSWIVQHWWSRFGFPFKIDFIPDTLESDPIWKRSGIHLEIDYRVRFCDSTVQKSEKLQYRKKETEVTKFASRLRQFWRDAILSRCHIWAFSYNWTNDAMNRLKSAVKDVLPIVVDKSRWAESW